MCEIVRYNSAGKAVVAIGNSFHHVFRQIPTGNWNYKSALDDIQNAVLAVDKSITSGALSNSRGQWFEWMVSIDLYNHWVENDHDYLFLNLPNIRRFDFASLYKSQIYTFVEDLRHKLAESLDINLVTSNPDYVIIDTRKLRDKFSIPVITDTDVSNLEVIDHLYQNVIGCCELDDIVGYFSLKTSLRPDRRLQIAHEGSLTKATYVHLQTRSWLMEPRGIKYFGGAMFLTQADIDGLKTVATHSITTVMSKPEKAVDKIFQIETREDLYAALNEMISIID
ncbi:Cfr10I/Bse634I family restriction endonuclease [Vibrio fluvialis]|uniref:Cfr10I/Bse634I family restriction endonuclease n=1 Tax=Vibrio fluvialis TaxID=676 RepID=UPI00155936FB|nr:Cfr10I/Bse634I family restriction endonuclease [Vibrio fluvialis]MBY7816203.1 Cfr10I/Bse634I family restriction endonuclease [Vibrio fluvialis]